MPHPFPSPADDHHAATHARRQASLASQADTSRQPARSPCWADRQDEAARAESHVVFGQSCNVNLPTRLGLPCRGHGCGQCRAGWSGRAAAGGGDAEGPVSGCAWFGRAQLLLTPAAPAGASLHLDVASCSLEQPRMLCQEAWLRCSRQCSQLKLCPCRPMHGSLTHALRQTRALSNPSLQVPRGHS